MEDKAIIDLYIARDEQAIQCTKEKYGRRLGRLAYEILRDRQTAEECENDTYWKVWNAIPPHQPYDYFYAFLVRLVRNTALDRCRSRKNKASFCGATVRGTGNRYSGSGQYGRSGGRRAAPGSAGSLSFRPTGGKAQSICAPLLVYEFGEMHCRRIRYVREQGKIRSLSLPESVKTALSTT